MASPRITRVAVGGKVPPHMTGPAAVAGVAQPTRPTVLNISLGVSGSGGVVPTPLRKQHNSPQTPLTPIITNGSLKTRLQGDYIAASTPPTKPGSQSPGTFASRVASQRHAHYRQSMDQPPKYDDIFCPPSPATTPAQTTHQAHRVIVNNIENQNRSSDKKHIKNYFLNHFSKPRTTNKSDLSSVNNNVNMGVGRGAGQGTGVEPCYREIHIEPPAGGRGQAKLNRQLSVSGPTTHTPAAGGGVSQQDLSGEYVLGLPVDGIPDAASQGRPFTISLKPGHYRVNVQWRSKQHPFRITLTPRKSSIGGPPAPPPTEQQPLLYTGEEHLSLPRRLVHRLLFRQPPSSGEGRGPVQQQGAQQGQPVYPIPLQQYTQQQQQQVQQPEQTGPGQPLHHTQSVNCPPLNHHRRGGGGVVPGSPGDRKGLKRGAWSEAVPGPGSGGGGRHSNAKQRKNRHRWASFSCMQLSSLEESHSETSGPESFSGYEGSSHLARHGAPPLGNKAQSLETLPSAVGQAAARVAAAAQGLTREAESCMEGSGGGSNARGGGSGDGSNSGGGGITNNVPNNLSSQGYRANPPIAEDLQEASVDDDSFIFIEKSQLMYNHAVSCEVLRNEDSDMNGITPSSEILTPRVNRKTWHEDEAFVRQVVDEYFKDPLPLSDEDLLETTQDTLTGAALPIDRKTGDTCMTSSHAGSDLSDILLEGLSCGSSLSSVHGEFSLSASSTDVEELTVRDQIKTAPGAIISPSIDNTTYCDSDESNSWFTDDSQGYEGDIEHSEKETLLGSGRVAWRQWRSAPDVRASAAADFRRQQRHQHWRHGHQGHHRRPPRPPPSAGALPVTASVSGRGATAVQGTGTSALPYCCCYSDTPPPRGARTTEDLPAGDLQLLPLTGPRFGYAPRKCLSVGDCKFGQVQRFKKHRLKKFDECGHSDVSSRHEGSEGARPGGDVALIDSNYHDLLSSTAESIFSEILDTTNSLYSETNDVSLASSQEFLKHNLNLEFVNKAFKPPCEYLSEGLNISENPNYACVRIAGPRPSESLEFVSGQYRAGLCGSVGCLDVVSGSVGGPGPPPPAAAAPPGGRCSCSELLCPCMLRRLEDLGSLGSGSGAPSTVDDSTGERTRKVLSNGLVVQNSDIRSSGPGPLDISSSESNLANKGLLVINSSYKDHSELCKSDDSRLNRSYSEGKVLFGGRSGYERPNSRDMREEQQRIMANAKASLNLLTPMPYHRPQGHHRAAAAPVGPPGRPRESTGETSSASSNVHRARMPSGEFRGVPPNAPVRTAASMDLLSGSSVQSSPVLRRATRVNHSPCRRTSRDNSATRFHMTSSETSLDSYEKHEQMYENIDGTGRPLMVQSLTNLARGEGLRQGTAAADAMSASVGAPCKFEYSKGPISGNSARGPPPAPKRTSSLEGPLSSSRSSLGESTGSRPNSDTSSSSVGSCCHHPPNPLSRILASRASITSSKKTSTPTTGTSSTSSATTPASVIHIGDARDDSENANNEFIMHKVQVAEGNKKKFVGVTQRTLIEVPVGGPVGHLFDKSKNMKSEVVIQPKISNNKMYSKLGPKYSEDDSTASYENLSSMKNTCISEYKFGVAPIVPNKISNSDTTKSNKVTISSPGDKVRSTEAVATESKKLACKNASSKSKSNSSSKSKPRKYFSGIINAIKGGNNSSSSSSSNSNKSPGHPPCSLAASVANGRESRLDMVQEVRGTGIEPNSSGSVPPPMVSPRSKRRGLAPVSSPTGSCLERAAFASSHSIDGSKNSKVNNNVRSSEFGGSIVFTNSRLSNNDNNFTSTEGPSPPLRRRNYSQPARTAAPTKQQQNHRTQSESPRTRRESGSSNLPKTSSKGISSSSYVFRRGNNDGKEIATEGLKDIKETSVSQESLNSSRESFYSSYEHPSSGYEQHSYENSSDYPCSKGHDRHPSGHDRHPSGHDRRKSGHEQHPNSQDRHSSGQDRHSSGQDRHSSGQDRHSSGQDRHSSGHDRHSGGFNRHSSGYEQVSNENKRHSNGSINHLLGHEQHPNKTKQPTISQGKSSSSHKHHLSGKEEPLKSQDPNQHSSSDSKKKASDGSKHSISNHINHKGPKANSGKCKLLDTNTSFSSGLDDDSNTKKNSNRDSKSKSVISNTDSKWELGSAIKLQLKDLGIDLDASMKGESNVLKNDKEQAPALYENLNFINSLNEHKYSNEPKKDDIKSSSKINNPGKTNKSTSSHTDSSSKHTSHQRSNKDKNTKSFSSSFASAGGLSDASNANSSSSSGKKDVGGRSGGPQCLGLGGLGGLDSSATKVSPGGRRRPPMSRPTGLPITPTRSRRSSLSSTNSGGSLSSPTRWRKTIADDIYCGEDSSEEGSREGQLSRSASTGSMVSESTSFYYTAGGSTLYDVPNPKVSEFESARNSIATEYASVRESFASDSLYEIPGSVSNDKSNHIPPDPASCESTTVSFTVRTPPSRPKRTISGDYNCDVDVSFSDGEIKVKVRTKEEEANRLHREKNGKGGRQGKDKKVKDNVQKNKFERDEPHSNSDVRLKDINSVDDKISQAKSDSSLVHHAVPCVVRSDSSSKSSVSSFRVKESEKCKDQRNTNSEKSCHTNSNTCWATSNDSENSPLYSNISEVKKEKHPTKETKDQKSSDDPLYVNLRRKGTKESRKNNHDSDSSDTETEDRRTSGVWRHGGDADGESSDGEDVEEESVSPSVHRYFEKTNKEPAEIQDQVFRIPRISQPDDDEEDQDEEVDDPAVEVSFDQSTGAPTPPRYASPRPTTPFSNECTNDSNTREGWDAHQGAWDWHRQVWEHHQQVHNQHLQNHNQMQQMHQQQSGLLNDVVTSLGGRWGNAGQYCHGHSPGSLHGSRGSSEDRGISPDRVSLRSSGTTSPCTSKPPPSPLPPSGRPIRDPSSVPRDSSRPTGREDRSCKSRRKARSASAGNKYRVEMEISPQVLRKPRPSSFCNLASRRNHSNSPEPVEDDLALELGLRHEEALYYLSSSGPAPSSLNRRGLAERKKNEGNELYKAKDYREALKLYAEAIKLCPDCAAYYSNRSACYMMLGKYHDALNDAREAVRLDSTFVKGYIRVAKCNIALGDATAALSVLRQASEYEPSNRIVRDEITNAQALIRCTDEVSKASDKQDYRTAIFHLDRALELAVGCRALKINKAEFLVFLHRYVDAQEIVNEILQYESSNADAIYVRGLCLYYQDNAEQAFNHFQQVLRFAPDHKKARDIYKKAKVLKQKKEEGNESFKKGEFQSAYNLYTEALAIDPLNKHTNAKLYFNRATVGSKLNNTKGAIDDCTAAINLDETYLKAYLRRAKCYQQEELHEEAVRDYEKVSKLDRTSEHKRLLHEAKIQLKRSKRKDYYKILGVQKGANDDEVKKSYRKMALVHHPDRHASASDQEKSDHEVKFKEIGEAYAVLTDAKKRAMYDRGQDVNDPDGGFGHDGDIDPNQIFQAFFGGGGHGGGFQFSGAHPAFQQQQQGGGGFPGQGGGHHGGNFPGGFHFQFG